jgi:hypothetical protein
LGEGAGKWTEPFTQGYNNFDINNNFQSYCLVTFMLNDGSETVYATRLLTAIPASLGGDMPTDPPSPDGYAFTGWNTKAAGGGTAFTGETAVSTSITVYAQRAPVFSISGRIRFDGGCLGTAQAYLLNGAGQIIMTAVSEPAQLAIIGENIHGEADFTISGVVPGTYFVMAHKKNHTTVKVTGTVVTDQNIVISPLLELYAGDLTATGGGGTIWGDGQINGLDASLLSMHFGQIMTPHPSDLNDNGQIEALDRSLFSKNFLKMSRVIPWS